MDRTRLEEIRQLAGHHMDWEGMEKALTWALEELTYDGKITQKELKDAKGFLIMSIHILGGSSG